MKVKRLLSGMLAALMVSSLFMGTDINTVFAEEDDSKESTGTNNSELDELLDSGNFQTVETVVNEIDAEEITAEVTKDIEISSGEESSTEETIDEDELVRVIIILSEESVIEENDEAVLNRESKRKMASLEDMQKSIVSKIEKTILGGEELNVRYQYTWLLNGIAAEVPYGLIDEIEAIRGVENVVIQPVYEVSDNENLNDETIDEAVSEGYLLLSQAETGEEEAWEEGYTGKGIKIAVIDSGIDVDHQSFAALPDEKLTNDSATKESVNAVLSQLHSYASYTEQLTVDQVYHNSKIAYGFNYVDNEIRITHDDYVDEQDHGTHVAGIAAANNLGSGVPSGVAPDAQLYVMKVFGKKGGAYTEDVLAAVEDAMILGADVINMSLGTPAGFTSEGEVLDEIYGRIAKTGTFLSVSAGNEGSSANHNLWETGHSLASNPDNGIIGSPATFVNAISVANAAAFSDGTYMYYSSSCGPAPDLSLEPDIITNGTSVYSTTDNGTYGYKTGTSMAAPSIAGQAALLIQYLRETHPEMDAAQRRVFVNTLLMSTAEPVVDIYVGNPYSPRVQGTGYANVWNAMKTDCYLSVDGMDVPKIELLDDPEKTGSYHYEFNVHNYGDETSYYELNTNAQTESFFEKDGNKFLGGGIVDLDAVISETSDALVKTLDYNEDSRINTKDARYLYKKVLNEKLTDLAERFRYDLNQDEAADTKDVQLYLDALVEKEDINVDMTQEILKVDPNEVVSVSVSVDLTETGKEYLDTNFENGMYVEGYTMLTAKSENAVNLSLPYLGFYGDWTKAPVFDAGYYWEDSEESGASQNMNILYTTKKSTSPWYPGENPYIEEEFNPEYISLSPNNDGSADYINEIQLSLLRNAKTLEITYTDDEDGTEYFKDTINNIRKTYYYSKTGKSQAYQYYLDYKLTDNEEQVLENNQKVTLTIKTKLDYDEHESANVGDTWEIPITIDTEAPELLETPVILKDMDTGRQYIKIKAADNVAVAAVNILSDRGVTTLAQYAVDHEAEKNEEYQIFEVTDMGNKFLLLLGDYAFNEKVYEIETSDNDYVLDESLLYGYRIADDNYLDDSIYGWLSIQTEDASSKVLSRETYKDALSAAEYVGGYIIGIDSDCNLVAMKEGNWDERVLIASLRIPETNYKRTINDMAFDPVSKNLYAYDASPTQNKLIIIDIKTGEVTNVTESTMENAVAITCSDEGILYGITNSGALKTIDKTSGMWNDGVLAETDQDLFRTQSMTFDSTDDSIYWACYVYSWMSGTTGTLYKIDESTYEVKNVGKIAGNAEVAGLLRLDTRGYEMAADEPLTQVEVEQEKVILTAGGTETLSVNQTPWYSISGNLTWSVEDASVAEVTQDGVVTAKAEGETKVTVTTENGLQSSCTVKVINPKVSLTGFVLSGNSTYKNQWVNISTEDLSANPVMQSENTVYNAAEYVDGFVYAYSSEGALYKINLETKETVQLTETQNDFQFIDMAYASGTNQMYAIARNRMEGTVDLLSVDLTSGEVTNLGYVIDEKYSSPYGMAVSEEGILYMMSTAGSLFTYDIETKKSTTIGSTGYTTYEQLHAMVYDRETDALYWVTRPDNLNGFVILYVDKETGITCELGSMDGITTLGALYTMPNETNE
ncbi:MAG: S8 family serine peptidase [Ruminococcus sp.]|nr:S8 family serine peptidase [Ruminococcus sp.]